MVELRVSAEKRGGRVCASAYCVFLNSATRIPRGGPPFPPSESILRANSIWKMCARRAAATVTARHLS